MNRHSPAAFDGRRPRAGLVLTVMLVANVLLVVPAGAAEPEADALPAPSLDLTQAEASGGPFPTTGPVATPALPQSGPTTGASADVTADAAGADTDAGITSPHYVDALAHAADRVTFEPGARVTEPFRPRAEDRWSVGGVAPRGLPAGRVSGADMAGAPQGSRWTTGTVAPATLDTAATSDTASDPAGTGLFREVFGFLPYWELSHSSLDLELEVLSTIAYFSVGVDRSGNLLKQDADGTPTTGWGGWTSSRMTDVINASHRSGTRVVLTITSFAWSTTEAEAQAALLGSAAARANLARQAASAVRDRGADGINLDFEPIASGQAANFTALVRSVRAELDAIAPGYQLTFDTTGFIGNYPIEAATAPGGADAIFLMGYDFRTSSAATSGSIAPLKGTSYDVGDAVAAYLARVPASKLILGVPYYGRVWSTQTDQPRSTNVSGTQYGASDTSIYTSAIATAAQHGRRWDATEASAWVAYQRESCSTTHGCVTSWRQLWYDDAQSLDLKYDLVNDRGLRGAGIWALGYDNGRAELDETLAANFLHDTAGPVAGINLLPSRQRDAGFVVGWSGRDVSGITSWTVQVSRAGGPWQTWIPTTTETSGVFLADTLTGYAFRVRATDRKGNVGGWDVSDTWRASPAIGVGGFAEVRTAGLAMRAAPSATTTQLGQLTTGQIISIVGGPVSAGGHTWWEAAGPLREWRAVSPVTRFWVAQGSATSPWLVGSRVPSSTWVDAVLRDLEVAVPDAATGDATARVFSPNGDGVRDRIRIAWTNGTALSSLRLRVVRPDGTEVGSLPLTSLAAGAQQLDWDGRLGTTLLPDGTYALALVGTAGGTAVAAPSSQPATTEQIARFGVRIDTTAPVLDGSGSSSAVLSPNGDGRLEDVTVTLRASEPVTWTGTARTLSGVAAGSIIRTSALPAGSWRWDGRSDGGTIVPDGEYRLGLGATDIAGNGAGRTWKVRVDTQPPAVTSSVGAAIFSPNGDGAADTVALKWSSPDAVSGRVEVLAGGVAIAGWPAGPSGTLAWNGRDKDNRPVRDGAYVLRVGLLDAAGNLARSDRRVVVDRALLLPAWSPGLFLPHDGDLLAPSATTSFQLLAAARTTVRILTHDNRYVRTAWVDRSLPAGTHRWTWNGRSGTGNLVARGWYRVVVTATSAVGTAQLSRLVLVDAFSTTLSSSSPAAGQRLVLDMRTAEPIVGVPSVTFRQTGIAAVKRAVTQMGTGRYRVEFTVAAAPGPASLAIAARDSRGGSNSQTVSVTVR